MTVADKKRKKPRPTTTGVLVVDKPAGMTSMDVVAIVRGRAGGARTGHAGTLDPLATGVLVVALGRATKIIDQLMATDKRYLARVDLSARTTTDDDEGDREEVAIAEPPTRAAIESALERFRGTIMQRPPAFSAVNVGGRRAYKLARQGAPPDLPPREVRLMDLTVRAYDWPLVDLELACGKGFYVRSLARDLGAALGTGGYCRSIRRTAVGPFALELARPLDEVPQPLTEADLTSVEETLRLVREGEPAG